MPHGKFRGKRISEIPKYYLSYAIENWTDIDPDLLWAMKMGLEKLDWNPPPKKDPDELMDKILCDTENYKEANEC